MHCVHAMTTCTKHDRQRFQRIRGNGAKFEENMNRPFVAFGMTKKNTHIYLIMFQVKASPLWQMLLIPLEKLEIEIRFFFEWLIEIVKMHRKYKVNFPRMMNVEAFQRYPNMMIHI